MPAQEQIDAAAFAHWVDSSISSGTKPYENGITYPLIIKAKYGHQFYEERKWQAGSIHFQDDTYDSLELMYDLITQEIVVKTAHRGTDGILLDNERLDAFQIGNDQFIALQEKGKNRYYQQLVDGRHFDLLSTHSKVLVLKPDGYKVEYNRQYFIYKDEKLNPLKTRSGIKVIDPKALEKCKALKSQNARWSMRKQEKLVNLLLLLDHAL